MNSDYQESFNKIFLHKRIAEFYATQRKPEETWKTLSDLEVIFDEIQHLLLSNQIEKAAKVFQKISFDYLLRWSNFRLVVEVGEKLQNKLESESILIANLANNIGMAQKDIGNFDQAINQFELGIRIAKFHDKEALLNSLMGNLGGVYSDIGNYDRAIELHSQALEISQRLKLRRAEGDDLGNLGNAYLGKRESIKAAEYQEAALAIAREIGNRIGEGNCLGNLGMAYSQMGNSHKAINLINECILIKREFGDKFGEAIFLLNLALQYEENENFQDAFGYYLKALNILREIGNEKHEFQVVNNLTKISLILEKYDQSISFAQQALKIAENIKTFKEKAFVLSFIGIAFAHKQEMFEALKYFVESYETAKDVGDRTFEALQLKNIANIYDTIGEKEWALAFQEVANEILKTNKSDSDFHLVAFRI